jgi:hydrogenase maturation protein HypF
MSKKLIRVIVEISGIVQGVGFRPFIFRMARKYNFKGYVLNDDKGVTIDAEGEKENVDCFIKDIPECAPLIAKIDSINIRPEKIIHYSDFTIKKSEKTSRSPKLSFVPISPDLKVCDDCISELWDPDDRRYFYPFINCTNCGPRFTIIYNYPYDRKNTTMNQFRMCDKCRKEYENPESRRFHAQPNACPVCGPYLTLVKNDGEQIYPQEEAAIYSGRNSDNHSNTSDPHSDNNANLSLNETIINTLCQYLKDGKIAAIKGLGGFHIACDALNPEPVNKLRAEKSRERKPFAVMFPDVNSIKNYFELTPEEEKLLISTASPILLLRKKKTFGENQYKPRKNHTEKKRKYSGKDIFNADIWDAAAPGNSFLGVMIPTTPLHNLILKTYGGPLIMTSGNKKGEPIFISNDDAYENLTHIADYFLLHNRDIFIRCDDSVCASFREQPYFYRRSRGYVPEFIHLKDSSEAELLALGAELKNTFCMLKQSKAILSHHMGDLKNLSVFEDFLHAIQHFKKQFNINPKYIVHDLHPGYLNTKWAIRQAGSELSNVKLISIQHHHAHIAACMGEHNFFKTVIGLALDGTGYGTDGTVWGGEILLADRKSYKRIGRLKTFHLPGGDMAVKQPWRIALAVLMQLGKIKTNELPSSLTKIGSQKVSIVLDMLEKKINCPETSSCGRLFDAVSALIDVCSETSFEGQAAIDLEQSIWEAYGLSFIKNYYITVTKNIKNDISNQADTKRQKAGMVLYKFHLNNADDGFIEIDWIPVIRAVLNDITRNTTQAEISLKFHLGLVEILTDVSLLLSKKYKINTIALSGGCFLNWILLTFLTESLEKNGLQVIFHQKVSTNDSGISFGQVAVADSILRKVD